VLSVDEQKDELTISGSFGDTQGTVEINSTTLTVKSWTNSRIVCDLPRTGDNASGDVSVIAGFPMQHSNAVPLTEWKGTVTCTQKSKGSLQSIMKFNLHFRTDVQDHRLAPHQLPVLFAANYANALDSSGTFETSGTYQTPDMSYTESWSGSGNVPPYISPTDPASVSNFAIQGTIDKDRNWSMAITALAKNGNHVHVVTNTSDTTVTSDIGWTSSGDLNGGLYLARLGTDFVVPAGSVTRQIDAEQSLTLAWTTMAPNHAPASDTPRSASRIGKRR
jgi:hypothetical protein